MESLWAAASGAAGSLLAARPKRWQGSGHDRVLVVAPHADDEAMGCAGSVLRHCQLGDTVTIAVVTDGSRSRALGFDTEAMASYRLRESELAAGRMGARGEWIGLREGEWSDAEGCAAIRRMLAQVRPTVIYAPSAIDFQPEHRRVAALLASVLADTHSEAEVRIYAIQVPLTPLLVNLAHDVSDLKDSIGLVLAAYATQRESVARTLRLRRYAARFYGGLTDVEAFCTMPADAYSALHERPTARFQALHIRAWADPLAALVGSRERLSWARRLRRPHSRQTG